MLKLLLQNVLNNNKNILLLGAHCDDIEIGCGGTISQLLALDPSVTVHWVVFSSNSTREKEARGSAEDYLANIENKSIQILKYENAYFPNQFREIKEFFEVLKSKVNPAVVFTHYRKDLHQDHRCINELTWNTFRNHLILEYEIAKYDGDLGVPNVFSTITNDTVKQKIDRLFRFYQSQSDKQWFTNSTFESMMRIRGIECNSDSGFAEAFYGRKLVIL